MNLALRLASIALLLAIWFAGSHFAGPRLLPSPQAVGLAIVAEARSGALAFNLGVTLARVAAAFSIAMVLGTVFGLAMGRRRLADRIGDPWLVLLLNLPALVIIVLAYIWAGLNGNRGARRCRAQQAAARHRHGARRRARARPQSRRDGAGVSHEPMEAACAMSSCRSSRPISPPLPAPACRWSGRSC